MTIPRSPICVGGPEVSQVIAGFWRLKNWGMPPQALVKFVEQNIELGVTTMDHAMVYRSEAPFGAALAIAPHLRDRIEIITKCGIRPTGYGDLGAQKTNHYDSSSSAIVESVENSLRDLGTDYIDILLLHRPDFLMDPHEVAEAFHALKSQGKVGYFGVSNFSCQQFSLLQSVWQEPLVTNQVEFSPYHMQALSSGVFEQCGVHSNRPMLWSCLAGGALFAPATEKGWRLQKALLAVADEIGAETIDQVVYAWVLALPCKPLPLLGTSKIERVRSAVKGVSLKLSREQWYRIWEASNGASVP